jgi:pectinesterase
VNIRSGFVPAISMMLPGILAAQSVIVQVKNPSTFPRQGEVVSVKVEDVRTLAPTIDLARAVVFDANRNTRALSQLADDEFLFMADCKAGGASVYVIRDGGESVAAPPSLVDGRHVLPRGDYAWENDRIAFRVYGSALAGDVRNGIDVWTKRVKSLVVAKWYRESEGSPPGKDAYHVDRGEGADFFSVGRSLGAGGSGLWVNGKVCQPGVFASWKTIANGPLRVCCELTYDSIMVDRAVYREVRRISLDAGQNLSSITVTYFGADSGRPYEAALGLVTRSGVRPAQNDQACWLSLWGPTTLDTTTGSLGTAVLVPPAAFAGFAADNTQRLLIARGSMWVPLTYYAGAGWTRSGDFASEEDWKSYLSLFAARLREPLGVALARGQN